MMTDEALMRSDELMFAVADGQIMEVSMEMAGDDAMMAESEVETNRWFKGD